MPNADLIVQSSTDKFIPARTRFYGILASYKMILGSGEGDWSTTFRTFE